MKNRQGRWEGAEKKDARRNDFISMLRASLWKASERNVNNDSTWKKNFTFVQETDI